ncbi:MAG: bifunctional DNA primase/polymerase, partial [Polyangiaceae bacterium]
MSDAIDIAPGLAPAPDPRAMLAAAREYHAAGLAVTPIRPRGKVPVLDAWQTTHIAEDALPAHFSGPCNIGVVLGAMSGGAIDIDLDGPEAITLAPEMLPPTGRIFGRSGKPRSHYEYVLDPVEPSQTRQYRDVTANGTSGEMLIEMRGDGGQTVYPPSIHVSGEAIVWCEPVGLPA